MKNKIQTVACIGTGTMGFSTALTCALAGFEVNMYGRSQVSLEKGFNNIKIALGKLEKQEFLTAKDAQEVYQRIKGVKDLEVTCSNADFLLESVAEDLALKKEMFKLFAKYCPPHTVMGSNTSGLKPSLISEGNSRANQIIATNFWNPAHLLPLVEIMPGKYTSEKTINIANEFITMLGKKPIIVRKEIPGYIGNRMQFALLREALSLLDEGVASAAEIDAAVKYGFARRLTVTGPIESADLGGLDIFYQICKDLWPDLSNTTQPTKKLTKKYGQDLFGSKTGKGFYDWSGEMSEKLKEKRENELIRWLKEDK